MSARPTLTGRAMFKQLSTRLMNKKEEKEPDPLEQVLPIDDVHSNSAADSEPRDVDWGDWSVGESTNNESSYGGEDPITPGTASYGAEETPKSSKSKRRRRPKDAPGGALSKLPELGAEKKRDSAADAISAAEKALEDSDYNSDGCSSRGTTGTKNSTATKNSTSSGVKDKKKKKKRGSKSSSSLVSDDGVTKKKRSGSKRGDKALGSDKNEEKPVNPSPGDHDAPLEGGGGGSSHKRTRKKVKKSGSQSEEENEESRRGKLVTRHSSDDELLKLAGISRNKGLTSKSMSTRLLVTKSNADDLKAASSHGPPRRKVSRSSSSSGDELRSVSAHGPSGRNLSKSLSSSDDISKLAMLANKSSQPPKRTRPVRANSDLVKKPSRGKSAPDIFKAANRSSSATRRRGGTRGSKKGTEDGESKSGDLEKVLEASERSSKSKAADDEKGGRPQSPRSPRPRSRSSLRGSLKKMKGESPSPGGRLSTKSKKKRSSSRRLTSGDLDLTPPLSENGMKPDGKKEKGSKDTDADENPEEEDLQRAEILRLQQQLSEALQKVVVITEEQIREKDEFLKVSTELSQLKGDFADAQRERDECKQQVERAEATAQTNRERIMKLEDAIERSLDEQDRLMKQLDQSEDDCEKLLIETQDLEAKLKDRDGGVDTEAIRDELKEAKKLIVDKDREIESQKQKIEHMTKDIQDNQTVNKLQVDELEEEKKALEGKIKGERLEMQSKMTRKDETIGTLQKELQKYKNDSDIQDVALVKAGLESAQSELEMARNDVERAERQVAKLRSEKEDLIERNNALNDQVKILHKNVNELTAKSKDLGEKVLQWTEKTYDWKTRAEKAEKIINASGDDALSVDSGDDLVVDESPQGLFLQSVMDKQTKDKGKRSWGNIFTREANGGEDVSGEAIRIKTLEDRNAALEETIASLKSEMVKMQTSHKGELYSSQKMVAQLQGENDALVLKNMTLEQLSNLEEFKQTESNG